MLNNSSFNSLTFHATLDPLIACINHFQMLRVLRWSPLWWQFPESCAAALSQVYILINEWYWRLLLRRSIDQRCTWQILMLLRAWEAYPAGVHKWFLPWVGPWNYSEKRFTTWFWGITWVLQAGLLDCWNKLLFRFRSWGEVRFKLVIYTRYTTYSSWAPKQLDLFRLSIWGRRTRTWSRVTATFSHFINQS